MIPFSLSDVPLIAWYIGVLVFLEGLLSADNALVLALMVRHLPKREQRKVLQWGIWGAILFRIVAVGLSAILLKFWIFKLIGGGYLLYLAIKHFLHSDPGHEVGADGRRSKFWGMVVSVVLTDIAFSIDSILAAVAMADEFPARFGDNGKFFIVLIGGVLGIITMRFVVRYFVILLDRFPGLAQGAYALVAWIGLKLVVSGLHSGELIPFHINDWIFWSVMSLIAVFSFVIRPSGPSEPMSSNLELLESEDSTEPDESSEETGEEAGPGEVDGFTGSDRRISGSEAKL